MNCNNNFISQKLNLTIEKKIKLSYRFIKTIYDK